MEIKKVPLKQKVEELSGRIVEHIENTGDTSDIKNLTSALKDLVVIESIRINMARNSNT